MGAVSQPRLRRLTRSPAQRLPNVTGVGYCRPKLEVGHVVKLAIHDNRWTARLPWKGK